MSNFACQGRFLALFDECLARYRAGDTDYSRYYFLREVWAAGDNDEKVVEYVLGGQAVPA